MPTSEDTAYLLLDDVELEYRTDTGFIYWSSDWARVPDLPGVELRHAGPGTFGHVDMYMTGCICPVTEPDYFGNRDLLERSDCPVHS